MTTTEGLPGTDTVWETIAESEKERLFSDLPVYTDVVMMCQDDDWERAQVDEITRWAVCLFRDNEDTEGWVTADVIAFPGVASEGATENEAIANVREALKLALDEMQGGEPAEMRVRYMIPPGGRVVFVTP